MKLLTIAIVDDERNVLLMVADTLEKLFEKHGVRAETERFNSAIEFEKRLAQKHFDVVFLDIDMPQLDGITFGKKLREQKDTIDIVYVSGREERVFDMFTARPLGFIRKGKFLKDSEQIIRLLIEMHSSEESDVYIDVNTNASIMSLRVKDLIYVESQKDYQYFYMKDKTEPIRLRSTMEKLEEQLEKYGFMRIHRGYLVGYEYIRRVDSDGVILVDGTNLPIGRRKQQEIRAKYLELSSNRGKKLIQ